MPKNPKPRKRRKKGPPIPSLPAVDDGDVGLDLLDAPDTDELDAAEEAVERALVTIEVLALNANQGNEQALSSLHEIAETAARLLNCLPVTHKKAIANTLTLWPVNLTMVAAENQRISDLIIADLELGKSANLLLHPERVSQREGRAKALAFLLIQFISHARVFGAHLRALSKAEGLDISKMPLVQAWQHYLLQRDGDDDVIALHSLVEIARFINLDWRTDIYNAQQFAILIHFGFASLKLRAPRTKGFRDEWFDLAISVLDSLTLEHYEACEYGLQDLGNSWAESHGGRDNPDAVRNGIRTYLKTNFMRLFPVKKA